MNFDLDRLHSGRLGPPPLPQQSQPRNDKSVSNRPTFSDHLKLALNEGISEVKFSNHAQTRAMTRNIEYNREQKVRLNKAVHSASLKGAKTALVLLDDTALIVGVDNRIVVTLMDQCGLKDNVFTAIDAAIVA